MSKNKIVILVLIGFVSFMSAPLVIWHANLYARVSQFPDRILAYGFWAASFVTDPICTAHRYIRQIPINSVLYPRASKTEKFARKVGLCAGVAGLGALSVITSPIGIALRWALISLQSRPFLYFPGSAPEKTVVNNEFTLFSWNVCCVAGGYSITDGGVLPWKFRYPQLVSQIQAQDADIVCLYEVFDIQTSMMLIQSLSSVYSHFYVHIGPNTIGTGSGMFVASKLKVSNPEFTPFPKTALHGRARYCKKGVFSFDIPCARIFSTHLQHSEIPGHPLPGEIEARRREFELIKTQTFRVKEKGVVVTGDLNLDEREFNHSYGEGWSCWRQYFDRGNLRYARPTWGGDQFAASLTGKPSSQPATLDYTLTLGNQKIKIKETTPAAAGFDGKGFSPSALSDHEGLYSVITVAESRLRS